MPWCTRPRDMLLSDECCPPAPAQSAPTMHEHRLTLAEILDLGRGRDGFRTDAEALRGGKTPPGREASSPVVVADQKWRSAKPPAFARARESTEWLSGRLGLEHYHIDP